jgi:hypothetical protein
LLVECETIKKKNTLKVNNKMKFSDSFLQSHAAKWMLKKINEKVNEKPQKSHVSTEFTIN